MQTPLIITLPTLRAFVGAAQRQAIYEGLRGEERPYFAEVLANLAATVDAMPATYAQNGVADPVAHLHYFTGGADWYITEKDAGSPDDDGTEGQAQAYGLADLFQDGGEMGYISIAEITRCGAELDFHFKPTPLSAIRARSMA